MRSRRETKPQLRFSNKLSGLTFIPSLRLFIAVERAGQRADYFIVINSDQQAANCGIIVISDYTRIALVKPTHNSSAVKLKRFGVRKKEELIAAEM